MNFLMVWISGLSRRLEYSAQCGQSLSEVAFEYLNSTICTIFFVLSFFNKKKSLENIYLLKLLEYKNCNATSDRFDLVV